MPLSAGDAYLVNNGGVTSAERAALQQTDEGQRTLAKIDSGPGASVAPGTPGAATAGKLNLAEEKKKDQTPKTQNKKIDPQPEPAKFPMVQVESGVASFTAHSHDPANIMKIAGQMLGTGDWSTHHHDHDGNVNEIVHAGKKSAAQNKTSEVAGHEDTRRGGGSHEQSAQGEHNVSGGDRSAVSDGAVHAPSSGSVKTYSDGGDGHHVMRGDQAFNIDEGGLHYEVGKDMYMHTGQGIGFNAGKFFHVDTNTDEGHVVGANLSFDVTGSVLITSKTNIKFQVAGNYIEITPNFIRIVSTADVGMFAKGGSGNVWNWSKNGSSILTGKTNIIKSDNGTTLEPSVVPPAGKVNPPGQ